MVYYYYKVNVKREQCKQEVIIMKKHIDKTQLQNIHNFIKTHYNLLANDSWTGGEIDEMFIITTHDTIDTNGYRIIVDDERIGIQLLSEHYFDENGKDIGFDNALDIMWYQLYTDKNHIYDDVTTIVDDFNHYASYIHNTIAQVEKSNLHTEVIKY